jgi:hypothetical protein
LGKFTTTVIVLAPLSEDNLGTWLNEASFVSMPPDTLNKTPANLTNGFSFVLFFFSV